MANRLSQLTSHDLRRAAVLKEKIQALETQLEKLLGANAPAPGTKKRRKKMSAEARAKIAAAQRRRWASRKRAEP